MFVTEAQGSNGELKRMIEAIFEDVGVQCLATFWGKIGSGLIKRKWETWWLDHLTA